MSIPAIAGAVGLQLVKGELPPVGIWPLTGGFVVALVLGIVTLKWVVNSLARGTFRRFSYYVFPLGLFIWLYFNFLAL
jgi:undecaprenyl pyrophosphate phosphatase UppP